MKTTQTNDVSPLFPFGRRGALILLLLPLWGMGVIASAQTIVPVSVDFVNHKHTFAVNNNGGKTSWIWIDYRKVNTAGTAYEGAWTRATISGVSSGTLVTASKGLWVAGNAMVTVTLSGMTGKYGWCAYASDTPPKAEINPAGGYILHGTPPFTVNNVKLADDAKTFGAGTCIESITDFTNNPAGIIPPAPAVSTTSPATICYNATAALSCTVSGGTTTAMTYTWNIGGATSVTYASSITTSNLTTATTYSVTVTNANNCPSAVSNTGTISVASSFTQTNLSAATICYNATATFSLAAASGGVGAITYRWEQSSNNSSWATASGTNNTAAYTTPALTSGSYYRRAAISANCGTITSSGAYVTVRTNFTAGSITSATVSTTPGTAPTANPTNATAASGGDTAITYEWRRTGTSEKTLTGSTSDYTLSSDNSNYSTAGTYYFTRYAKDGTCNTTFTASSGQYMLTVLSPYPPYAGTFTWTCGAQTWSGPLRNDVTGCTATTNLTSGSPPPALYRNDGLTTTGYYYNWTCATEYATLLCPAPWRVPSISDIEAVAACASAATVLAAWGSNSYASGKTIQNLGTYGRIQSSSAIEPGRSYYMYYPWTAHPRGGGDMGDAYQVRCVK